MLYNFTNHNKKVPVAIDFSVCTSYGRIFLTASHTAVLMQTSGGELI
jgi:hypothetical protein